MALGYDDQTERYLQSARDLGFQEGPSGIGAVLALRRGNIEEMHSFVAANIEAAGADPAIADLYMAAAADDAALAELEAAVEAAGDRLGGRQSMLPMLILSGRTEEALALMDEITRESPDDLDLGLLWIPEAALIRRDPRFGDIMKRVGLVNYWKQYGPPDDCRLEGEVLRCGFLAVAGR
jgi:hypothetical protein